MANFVGHECSSERDACGFGGKDFVRRRFKTSGVHCFQVTAVSMSKVKSRFGQSYESYVASSVVDEVLGHFDGHR